jgi:hypothetical protein
MPSISHSQPHCEMKAPYQAPIDIESQKRVQSVSPSRQVSTVIVYSDSDHCIWCLPTVLCYEFSV